jgi:SAM-dependent methyltransferase
VYVFDIWYMKYVTRLLTADRISNAALHWILRDESTRMSTLRAIYDCLKPGGTYVFEMGGHGNVAEVNTALIFALVQHGIPVEQARETSPWFFPSDTWMKKALEEVGFKVENVELEYRSTQLTADAKGGLAGWVRLMGAQFLEVLPEEKRDAAVRQICDVLQNVVTRGEDGSQSLGYVRLRGIAKKI